MSAETKPLASVMGELANLVRERASGVQSIATDDGRFALVKLQAGVVREVSFKAKYNDEAILQLALVRQARARFDKVLLTLGATRHPPISESLLQWMLSGFVGRVPSVAPAIERPITGQITPAQRSAIEQAAVRYLGPFAKILCEEAFAATSDVEVAVAQIASNMNVEAEARGFLVEASTALATVKS